MVNRHPIKDVQCSFLDDELWLTDI